MTPLKSTPGAKPRVDYCLVGHMEGEVVYKVPVEAQKFMTTDDLGQLAHYRGSMHYTKAVANKFSSSRCKLYK